MEHCIEYELNVTSKNHWIFYFRNTLRQFIICRSKNAESVRCALPVDGFLVFPCIALYINLSLHSAHRWIFLLIVFRDKIIVLIGTWAHLFHDLFLYCAVFPISLCFSFSTITSLFNKRKLSITFNVPSSLYTREKNIS